MHGHPLDGGHLGWAPMRTAPGRVDQRCVRTAGILAFAWVLGCGAVPAFAGEAPRFGGPDSVGAQLAEDSAERQPLLSFSFLDPWFAGKTALQERTGVTFGLDYSAVYLHATESPGEDSNASGMVRFFGTWDLFGRETEHPGSLVWKAEHRHAYTESPPSALSFDMGYVGLFAPPFNDDDTRVTNLYWKQRFMGGRIALTAGFLDATDYVDAYALASPWLHFLNLTFSSGSASIALPGDAMLGIAAAGMLTENFYAIAGVGDANADPNDPFEGFNTFFNDNEYFTSLELGWTTSPERIILDNVHVTAWHVDARRDAGTPEGWGINFSASTYLNEHWMPFLRGGYADDGGSLLQGSVSAGLGYQTGGGDLLGVAFNWGDPNSDSFGSGLSDQWSFEAFYRWQLAEHLAITPDVQFILDPALNPGHHSSWVFGLRVRLAL